MSKKNANSVMKLVSNKLFITLLVFALGIIMISAVFTHNLNEVAENVSDDEQEIAVTTEVEEEKLTEIVTNTEEYSETVPAVEEYEEDEPETVEVLEEISYKIPLSGELQKEFSVEELLWDETMQDWRTHTGIDIGAETGSEVDTAAPGTVIDAYKDEMYGFVVKVQHDDGNITVYKNLEKSVVSKGNILDDGQMIGTVGNSGSFEMAQKPHLHFEIISEEKYKNPMEYIK